MFELISNFFATSIAALSIYDLFIILLFILTIILTIISGIIVVSSRVKKINAELDKRNSIQNINDKIIQNRLDLIINKITTNVDICKRNQEMLLLNNISNRNIKQAINSTYSESAPSNETETGNEVIKLPPPGALGVNDNHTSSVTATEPNNQAPEQSQESNLDNTTNENIIISTPSWDELPEANNEDNNEDVELSKSSETIQLNTNNIPEDVLIDEEETAGIQVDIHEDTSRPDIVEVRTIESTNSNREHSSSSNDYDSEPRESAQDTESTLIDVDNQDLETAKISYSSDDQTERSKGIVRANKMLNTLGVFSANERFRIVDLISDDGRYINCLINDKLVYLDFKQLLKQLMVQRLNEEYKYPLDNIEIGFPIRINKKNTRKADVVVFDRDDNPYIICLILPSYQTHGVNLLHKLMRLSHAPFGVILNEHNIKYYNNNNKALIKMSDLPTYHEEIDKHLDYYENTLDVRRPSTSRLQLQQSQPQHLRVMGDENEDYTYSKDNFNIYRKNPYHLSEGYQAIMSKYRPMQIAAYRGDNSRNIYGSNRIIPVSYYRNQHLLFNNTRFNLNNNRDSFMNRNNFPSTYPYVNRNNNMYYTGSDQLPPSNSNMNLPMGYSTSGSYYPSGMQNIMPTSLHSVNNRYINTAQSDPYQQSGPMNNLNMPIPYYNRVPSYYEPVNNPMLTGRNPLGSYMYNQAESPAYVNRPSTIGTYTQASMPTRNLAVATRPAFRIPALNSNIDQDTPPPFNFKAYKDTISQPRRRNNTSHRPQATKPRLFSNPSRFSTR